MTDETVDDPPIDNEEGSAEDGGGEEWPAEGVDAEEGGGVLDETENAEAQESGDRGDAGGDGLAEGKEGWPATEGNENDLQSDDPASANDGGDWAAGEAVVGASDIAAVESGFEPNVEGGGLGEEQGLEGGMFDDQGVDLALGDSFSKENPEQSFDQSYNDGGSFAEGSFETRDQSFDSSGRPFSADEYDEYGEEGEEGWGEEGEGEWGEGDWGELEGGNAEEKKAKQAAALTNPLGDNFMDFAWKKPDKELAEKRGIDGLWQGGERSFMKVGVHDFGEMSDGMELYFYVVKSFALMFFVLSMLAMPMIVIANAGNDGLAIPLPPPPNSGATLGNMGYNPSNPKAASFCKDQDGEHMCRAMRWIYGLEVQAKYVTFVVSGFEALSCLVLIFVSTWLVMKVEQLSSVIDDDSSTPSDFTVYVRNLPKDVSEGALLAHFSMRYALEYEQPEFPILGLSSAGASVLVGFLIAVVFSGIAGGSVAGLFGALGTLATPFVLLLFTGIFALILWLCGFGKERNRLTPGERWDEMEEKREWHRLELQREREEEEREALGEAQGLKRDMWGNLGANQVGVAPLGEDEAAAAAAAGEEGVELHPDLPTIQPGQVAPEEIYDNNQDQAAAAPYAGEEGEEYPAAAESGAEAAAAAVEEDPLGAAEAGDGVGYDGGGGDEYGGGEGYDEGLGGQEGPGQGEGYPDSAGGQNVGGGGEDSAENYEGGDDDYDGGDTGGGGGDVNGGAPGEAVADDDEDGDEEDEDDDEDDEEEEAVPPATDLKALKAAELAKASAEAGAVAAEAGKDKKEGVGDGDDEEDEDSAPRKKVCCACCYSNPLCCLCKDAAAEEESAYANKDWDGLNPPTPRPDPKAVGNSMHSGYPQAMGMWVADLNIVYPNGKIIALYLRQKLLMEKIEEMREKVKQYKEDTEHGGGAKPNKEKKAHKALAKLSKRMSKTFRKVAHLVKDSRKAADCEGCFITFHHEESQARCLEDYRASGSWLGRYFQPKHLRFMWHTEDPNTGNKVQSLSAIRVEQASEPSDIFWENLHVSDGERFVRIVFSNLITLTVLIISFAIALYSTKAGKIAADAIRSTDYCDDFPAVWYGRYYNTTVGDLWEKPVKWVRNRTIDADPDGPCEGGRVYIVNQEFDMDWRHLPDLKPLPYEGSTEAVARPVRRYTADYDAWLTAADAATLNAETKKIAGTTFTAPEAGSLSGVTYYVDDDALTPIDGSTLCDDVCHSPNPAKNYPNRTGCRTLSCLPGMRDWAAEAGYNCAEGSILYPPSAVANCYCKQAYLGFRPAIFGMQLFGSSLPEDEVALCSDFEQSLNDANYFTYLAILMVVVINAVSLPVIKLCVGIEMRNSVSQEKKALVSKMFSLQFMNTALITLIVNTAYGGEIPLGPFALIGVGEGSYSDFSMEWYMTIGASLASTMLVQIYTPHQGILQNALVVNPLKRKLMSDMAATQKQLDDLYQGMEFMIEARAAVIGVGLMVTLMYSTGIPMLTVFAFFNFCAAYVVDKFMLIKYYEQPPMYGPAVPKVLVNLLPLGTFIHMAVGLYMLSNENLLWGPDLTSDAEDEAKEASASSEFLRLVMPRIVRMHTLFLFMIFCGYSFLFVLYLFGWLDEFAESVILLQGRMYAACCGTRSMKIEAAAAALDHEEPARPAFCDPYISRLTSVQKEYVEKHKKLSIEDTKRGFSLTDFDGKPNPLGHYVKKVHLKDTVVNGVKRRKGAVKFTWEHIADNTVYTYDIGRCKAKKYRTALLGIKSSKLPIPSRKMRIEDDDPDENPYAIGVDEDEVDEYALAMLNEMGDELYNTEGLEGFEEEEDYYGGEDNAEGGGADDGNNGAVDVKAPEDTAATETPDPAVAAGDATVAPEATEAAEAEAAGEAGVEGGSEVAAGEAVPETAGEAEAVANEEDGGGLGAEPEEAEPELTEEEKEAKAAAEAAEDEARAKADVEEAERKRVEDDAAAKAAAEEEERQRIEDEARLKAEAEEAERQRIEEEARLKAEAEEAERQRADAEASAKAAEEAEFARLKAEAKEAAERQAQEEADEAARLQAEAEAAELAEVIEDEDAEEL